MPSRVIITSQHWNILQKFNSSFFHAERRKVCLTDSFPREQTEDILNICSLALRATNQGQNSSHNISSQEEDKNIIQLVLRNILKREEVALSKSRRSSSKQRHSRMINYIQTLQALTKSEDDAQNQLRSVIGMPRARLSSECSFKENEFEELQRSLIFTKAENQKLQAQLENQSSSRSSTPISISCDESPTTCESITLSKCKA